MSVNDPTRKSAVKSKYLFSDNPSPVGRVSDNVLSKPWGTRKNDVSTKRSFRGTGQKGRAGGARSSINLLTLPLSPKRLCHNSSS